MDIEKIVAAMPKAPNNWFWEQNDCCQDTFRKARAVQCLFLAEQGWRKVCFCDPEYSGEEHCSGFCHELRERGYRKVPSVSELMMQFPWLGPQSAEQLHHYLLEGGRK